jgi:hypothetical protein
VAQAQAAAQVLDPAQALVARVHRVAAKAAAATPVHRAMTRIMTVSLRDTST